MRVLTLLLFLAVIVLISNASPPKKRGPRNAVSAPKRPFKSTAGRQNSAAARAFFGPKSAKNKQLKKAIAVNNRRSLQKGIGAGSSNNGKARRAAAPRSRVGNNRSRANPANNTRRGPGSRNRNSLANRPPFADIPDDVLLDDEQYLDELPDNDLAFELPEYKEKNGRRPNGDVSNKKKEVTEMDKPPAESGAEKSCVEKNIDYNDENEGIDADDTVADESSEEVEKQSGASSGTQPTAKISDDKDYDFEDLNEEELSEGDYEI